MIDSKDEAGIRIESIQCLSSSPLSGVMKDSDNQAAFRRIESPGPL